MQSVNRFFSQPANQPIDQTVEQSHRSSIVTAGPDLQKNFSVLINTKQFQNTNQVTSLTEKQFFDQSINQTFDQSLTIEQHCFSIVIADQRQQINFFVLIDTESFQNTNQVTSITKEQIFNYLINKLLDQFLSQSDNQSVNKLLDQSIERSQQFFSSFVIDSAMITLPQFIKASIDSFTKTLIDSFTKVSFDPFITITAKGFLFSFTAVNKAINEVVSLTTWIIFEYFHTRTWYGLHITKGMSIQGFAIFCEILNHE